MLIPVVYLEELETSAQLVGPLIFSRKDFQIMFGFAEPIDLFTVTHSESLLRAAIRVFCQLSDKAAWSAGGYLCFICVSQ